MKKQILKTMGKIIFCILFILILNCCQLYDTKSPTEVTELTTLEGNSQVRLKWTEPTDADFSKVEITYTPDGETLIEVLKGTSGTIINDLTNGTEYTFTLVTVDDAGNKSKGTTIKVTLNSFSGANACVILPPRDDIGTGASNIDLIKTITINNTTASDFTIPATVNCGRKSTSTDYFYMAIPVQNISGQSWSFIEITYTFYDVSNNALDSGLGFTFVHGNIGDVGSSIYTNTCLAAGETGYGILISDCYSTIDHINLSITMSDAPSDPGPRILAQSYSYDDNSDDITITIKNSGSIAANVDWFSTYILLDSNGLPLCWDSFIWDVVEGEHDFQLPVAQSVIDTESVSFEGISTGGIVFLTEFDSLSDDRVMKSSPSLCSLSQVFNSQDEQVKNIIEDRNRQIDILKIETENSLAK